MPAADPLGAVAELAASQHGAVSRSQAASLGLDRRAVRRLVERGLLQEPIPTVLRLVGAPATWKQRATLPTLTSACAAVSHLWGARLHDLLGDEHLPGDVQVTIERNSTLRAPGVAVHRTTRWSPGDLTVVDGIRCTSIARTLCDLGAAAPIEIVEQATDEALRRGVSRKWIEQRLVELHRPGPSGTGALSAVLALPDRLGELPDSWFERVLARSVVAKGLPPLTLQHPVEVEGHRFRLDGAYPEMLLAVEADSHRFHGTVNARRRDRRRDHLLRSAGWEVLYAGWEDRHLDTPFLDALREAIQRRSTS